MQASLFKQRYLITLCTLLVLFLCAVSTFVSLHPSSTLAAAPATTLTLQFTCAQAVDYTSGQVCVQTQATAALTIKIKYCSGYYATSTTLRGTKYANPKGQYTWHWIPQTSCRGLATAYVTAALQGQKISKSDVFTVK